MIRRWFRRKIWWICSYYWILTHWLVLCLTSVSVYLLAPKSAFWPAKFIDILCRILFIRRWRPPTQKNPTCTKRTKNNRKLTMYLCVSDVGRLVDWLVGWLAGWLILTSILGKKQLIYIYIYILTWRHHNRSRWMINKELNRFLFLYSVVFWVRSE